MFEFITNMFNYLFGNFNNNNNNNNHNHNHNNRGVGILFTCYHCGHRFHTIFPLESCPPQDICPQCNKYVH